MVSSQWRWYYRAAWYYQKVRARVLLRVSTLRLSDDVPRL
jgi:hypothetical protein